MALKWTSVVLLVAVLGAGASGEDSLRTYNHRLTPVVSPKPLLADHPEYVEPMKAEARFEAPLLIEDTEADLDVRAWRFSYNARGIIEVPNRLQASRTAVIVVHPWGVDDGQGWRTPEPAGVAFFCTPEKNRVGLKHMKEVVNPWLRSLRDRVKLIAYSLPGKEDAIRKKIYRSFRGAPAESERQEGLKELADRLKSLPYTGAPIPAKVAVSRARPAVDYFRQFSSLDAGPVFNGKGFWDVPIPVAKVIEVAPRDLVIYDGDGYPPLREFLQQQGIRHILLAGYNTDKCVCSTTAGYRNLSKDFNVFLVGDATLATYPAHDSPRFATHAAVALASLEVFITQVSWIQDVRPKTGNQGKQHRGTSVCSCQGYPAADIVDKRIRNARKEADHACSRAHFCSVEPPSCPGLAPQWPRRPGSHVVMRFSDPRTVRYPCAPIASRESNHESQEAFASRHSFVCG